MSATLTIRLAVEDKIRLEQAAAAVQETVGEYVRNAVQQRAAGMAGSPWDRHLGAARVAVPPPTNKNVRKAMARRRRPGR